MICNLWLLKLFSCANLTVLCIIFWIFVNLNFVLFILLYICLQVFLSSISFIALLIGFIFHNCFWNIPTFTSIDFRTLLLFMWFSFLIFRVIRRIIFIVIKVSFDDLETIFKVAFIFTLTFMLQISIIFEDYYFVVRINQFS